MTFDERTCGEAISLHGDHLVGALAGALRAIQVIIAARDPNAAPAPFYIARARMHLQQARAERG